MHQLFHVLVVDRQGRAAAVQTLGDKWVLPIVSCPERMRSIPAIAGWIERQGMQSDVIGQWLGRLAPDACSIDWLVVVRANDRGSFMPAPQHSWTSFENLSSSPSILEYQQWAIGRAISDSGSPSVGGPFGAITWCDEVRTWIRDVIGAPIDGPITTYRAGPHEIVIGVSTRRGPMYVKGLSADRATEALVTSKLAAAFPEMFARTHALTSRSDGAVWWLAEECVGSPLMRAVTMAYAENVVVACARIQKRIVRISDLQSVLPRLDLPSSEAWSLDLLERNNGIAGADEARETIGRAFDQLNRADVAIGWVPMDLDPANVFIDDTGAVRFIDLDDSFLGPAPLAVSTFAQRLKCLPAGQMVERVSTDALYRAYERSWPLSALGDPAWRAFEVASIVLDAHLGWRRVVRNVSRGEVFGPLETMMARIAQRLARALKVQSETECPVISKTAPAHERRI